MKRIVLFVALLFLLFAPSVTPTSAAPLAPHVATVSLLPGEGTIGGVPAFDFGTNDSVNWDTQYNMDMAPDGPTIQGALKAAGIPISRVWFFQYSLVDNHAMTDGEQLQKLAAVQAAGMVCFANFPTANTVAYDMHLLSILHGACPYVEVMNEPDIEGVNSTAYLAFWNSFVPQARKAYPGVLFGGPADYDNQGNECTYDNNGNSTCFLQKVMQGMKASGVLPDFVTYHWYPCWNNDAASCLALAGSFASAAQQVIGWADNIFGKAVPVVCSEWNADPGNPAFMSDRNWDSQFVTAALQNMETSGLAGAMEYDIAGEANYGADDMFDVYNGGAPFQTFTGFAAELARVRGGGPTPTPTPVGPTPTPVPPTPTPGGGNGNSASVFTNQAPTTSLAFPAPVAAGDTLVATVGVAGGNTYNVSSVTDTQGNTWTRAVTGTNGDESEADVWYTHTAKGGSDTVTATLAGSGFVQTVLSVDELTGSLSVAGTSAQESNGTAHSAGTLPTGTVVALYVDGGYGSVITLGPGLSQVGSPFDNTVNIEADSGTGTGNSFTTATSTYGEVAAVSFVH